MLYSKKWNCTLKTLEQKKMNFPLKLEDLGKHPSQRVVENYQKPSTRDHHMPAASKTPNVLKITHRAPPCHVAYPHGLKNSRMAPNNKKRRRGRSLKRISIG